MHSLVPQFASCIKSIAAQDPEQLTARYGLPNDLMGRSYEGKVVGAAERLRHQAIYLRELGALQQRPAHARCYSRSCAPHRRRL